MSLRILNAAGIEVVHVPELPASLAYKHAERPFTLFVGSRLYAAMQGPRALIEYDWNRLVQWQTGGA